MKPAESRPGEQASTEQDVVSLRGCASAAAELRIPWLSLRRGNKNQRSTCSRRLLLRFMVQGVLYWSNKLKTPFRKKVRIILLIIKDIWSVQSVIKRANNKMWNQFNLNKAYICTCTAHLLSSVQCVSLLYRPATTTQIRLNTTLFRNIHHVNIV